MSAPGSWVPGTARPGLAVPGYPGTPILLAVSPSFSIPGPPYFQWTADTPFSQWVTDTPYFQWATGEAGT